MKIIRNNDPLWTAKHLEHYRKYGNVYGLELTGAEIEQQINMLQRGSPGQRYGPETECFDIYTEAGELAGDITLTLMNQIPELGIVIFDQFAGRGYAQKALAVLKSIAQKKYNRIEAVIKSTNPNRDEVRHILESEGFVFRSRLPGGGLFFELDLLDMCP